MHNRYKSIVALVKLDFACTYRFPVLEIMCAFLLYIVYVAGAMMSFSSTVYIGRYPGWNGTAPAENLVNFFDGTSKFALGNMLYGLMTPLVIIIPLLTALSIARCFEDRTVHTLLTYPVRRSTLLGVKAIIVVIVSGTITTVASVAVLSLFFPQDITAGEVLMLIGAIWFQILLLVSVASLFSILTKRVSVAALGAIGFWYSFQALVTMGSVQGTVLYVMSPLIAVATTIWDAEVAPSPVELPLFLIQSMILGLVLLVISLVLFEKSDV